MRHLAFKATLYSCLGLLFAVLVGESILLKWGVPLPVLTFAGGIILFLVALRTVLQQYIPSDPGKETVSAPSPSMAMMPLAFPTIVTPYGIAAVIIFIAISPDMSGRLAIGGVLLGIMVINMLVMLASHHILRWMGMLLQILGPVLGILQVALGLQIMLYSFRIMMME